MSRVGIPVSKPPGNNPTISKKRKGMGDLPPNGIPTGYPPYPQHYPQGPYGSQPPHSLPPHPYGPYAPQHQPPHPPPPPHAAHGPQQPPPPHYPPHANWPPNGPPPPPHHAPPHPPQSGGYGQPWGMHTHPQQVYHPGNNPSSPDRPPQQWVNTADYHPGNNAPNLPRHHSPSRVRTSSPPPPGSNTTPGGAGAGAWHSQQQQWPPQTTSSQPPPRPQHPSTRGGQPQPQLPQSQSQPPNPTQSGGGPPPPPNQSYGHPPPPPSSRGGWNPSSSPTNGIEWSGGSVGGGSSHNGGVSSVSTTPRNRASPSSGMGSKGNGGSQDGMGDIILCQEVDENAEDVRSKNSDKDSDKGRGSYRCGRCGAPKKGHVCPYQPKFKRRPDEPPPETRNASTQVEMDEFLVLRRLNLEIQGFPESYTSNPANNVGAEPHHRPPHPSSRPHGGVMSSPDGPSSMHQSSSPSMASVDGSGRSVSRMTSSGLRMKSSGSPGMSTHSGGSRGGEGGGGGGIGMVERRSSPMQQQPSEGERRGEIVGRGAGGGGGRIGGGCLPKDVRSSSTSPRNLLEGHGSRVN